MGSTLTYPLTVTCGTLVVIAAWVPYADLDQLSALVVVALAVLVYTGYQVGFAFGLVPTGLSVPGTPRGRRVRQQHRLVSRSWLEIGDEDRVVWLPVFYDPALVTLTPTELEISGSTVRAGDVRCYPAGRVRTTEPPGKLIDNPSRPAAPPTFGTARRLLLDLQPAIAAPFAGLLWVYVMNGGLPAFVAATIVAAATFTWLCAIRGSDPS
ncbi:hypothetical protein ACFO5K_21240 [Nocardia halotolerans]|uniref:PH domain-containing protein n=1 Tax=Nocardia halotolerans TaxID=1755878 RepID=A0ABV8VM29_9NOCA